jgi:CMP-N,N'-diacetyllegionaminic acid synthase
MKLDKKVIAIIPARGGSKGIPEKNLVQVNHKPLLFWSVNYALSSNLIDDVYVSSDSLKILNYASSIGAKTIIRPNDISGDSASSEDAWIHAIKHIEQLGVAIDIIIGMQATSPIREDGDIDNAIIQFRSDGLDSLFSSALFGENFHWSFSKKTQQLESVNYDYKNRLRRQEIEPKFLETGSFYIFKPELIKINSNRLAGKIGHFLTSKISMFQIDEVEDIFICDVIMKNRDE